MKLRWSRLSGGDPESDMPFDIALNAQRELAGLHDHDSRLAKARELVERLRPVSAVFEEMEFNVVADRSLQAPSYALVSGLRTVRY